MPLKDCIAVTVTVSVYETTRYMLTDDELHCQYDSALGRKVAVKQV